MSLPARLRWRGTALFVALATLLAALVAAVPPARAFSAVPHGVPARHRVAVRAAPPADRPRLARA